MRLQWILPFVLFTIALLTGGDSRALPVSAVPSPPPVARVQPVTDVYFGTSVTDPYRWMEKTDDPAVQGWMKAQSNYSNAILASLPGRSALVTRLKTLFGTWLTSPGVVQIGGRDFFYTLLRPNEGNDSLFVRDSLGGKSRLVFDPNHLSSAGDMSIGLYTPSNSGRYVALDTTAGGSESGTLKVIESATGRSVGAAIDRVRTNVNVPSWLPGDTSFFYERFPKLVSPAATAANEERGQVFLHHLGTDSDSDTLIFGYGVVPAITPADFSYAVAARDSDKAIGIVQHGTSNLADYYVASIADLRRGDLHWHSLGKAFMDFTISDPGRFGFIATALHEDDVYLINFDAAERTELVELRLSSGKTIKQARVVVPAGDSVIENIAAASDGLYISSERAGISHLSRMDFDSHAITSIALPASGSMGLLSTGSTMSGVVFDFSTWTQEDYYLNYSSTLGRVRTILLPEHQRSLITAALTSDEILVTSSDGTRVPLSIIHEKALNLDGSHPALLEGYGAYGLSQKPFFDPTLLPWLERGGVYAVAHPRGGGEFGEPWHQAGKGSQRQHSVDDFVACARYLIAAKFTLPSKLGIWGQSAGGTLIANAFLQHPDLFGYVIDTSGMLDLVRSELTPNGPANIPEIGSTRTAAGFESLYKMSPYQHVVSGATYPAVLLTTGSNDPRVPPWIVAKMAARLQAATASGRPILLKVSYGAGHFGGSTFSQAAGFLADILTFAFWQSGDHDFQQPGTRLPTHRARPSTP